MLDDLTDECSHCSEPVTNGFACCDEHEDYIFCSNNCAMGFHEYLADAAEWADDDAADLEARAMYYETKYGERP